MYCNVYCFIHVCIHITLILLLISMFLTLEINTVTVCEELHVSVQHSELINFLLLFNIIIYGHALP